MISKIHMNKEIIINDILFDNAGGQKTKENYIENTYGIVKEINVHHLNSFPEKEFSFVQKLYNLLYEKKFQRQLLY